MSELPLQALVTPAPAGNGPWPAGRPGASVPGPGAPGSGSRPEDVGTPGENPFQALLLGFFQASQVPAAEAAPGSLGDALGSGPPTPGAGAAGPGPAALPWPGTAAGGGKPLPWTGEGLPQAPGVAPPDPANLPGVLGSLAPGTDTADGTETATGLPAGRVAGLPGAMLAGGDLAPVPQNTLAAGDPAQAAGTGGLPPSAEGLLAQIRMARSGRAGDGGWAAGTGLSEGRRVDVSLPEAGAAAPGPGVLAPLPADPFASSGPDLGPGGPDAGLAGLQIPGLQMSGLQMADGNGPPGPGADLASAFSLDPGRRLEGDGRGLLHVPVTAPPTPAPGHLLNPAPGPLPSLPDLGDAGTWSRSLGDRLLGFAEQGLHSARLKLHPEHLGELNVRIQVEDGEARVWFQAHHPQAREALESALPRLRELFAESGLALVGAQVDSGPGGQAGDGRQGGLGDGEFGRDGARETRPTVSPPATPLPAAWSGTGDLAGRRRLDVLA